MRCYCGQARPGVWDQHGIVHSDTGCRWTDRLTTITYRVA